MTVVILNVERLALATALEYCAKRAAIFSELLQHKILADVPHAQWVFSIPKMLKPYFLYHVGRAIPNFYRAEHDPLSNDILVTDGYKIEDGTAKVPQAPGAGITIDESKLASGATIRFDVSA